jgi:hypothetical protein
VSELLLLLLLPADGACLTVVLLVFSSVSGQLYIGETEKPQVKVG